jgi:hypothetical protein
VNAYHLCPAPGTDGSTCLAPLPCEEHGVPDPNAAWVLYGHAYTEERTVHGWGGWPGWVALGCIAGITVLIGGALCAGLFAGAVGRWRERR